MKVLYRISDGGNIKDKLPFANKIFCLTNFCNVFENIEIFLFADNCKEDTLNEISKFNVEVIKTRLGNAKSWRFCVEFAIQKFSEDEIVYLVEDDYLHLEKSSLILEEGIEIADYVTLYDHPDKYVNKKDGGNPFIINGGEKTKVFITKSIHWKQTNSTTMTFASKVKTLKEDKSIWWKHTKDFPHDFAAFKQLCSKGSLVNNIFGKNRKLISCIPGKATHIEPGYLSPMTNWNQTFN